MMALVDDAETPEQKQEHAPDPKTNYEKDNQSEKKATGGRRERAPSEAARRDDRESERATRHEQKTRMSILNNRFLARKESRATSGDANGGRDAPTRTKHSPTKKKTPERQPQDGDDDDTDDRLGQQIVEESALVVTRMRSSAASSVSGRDKTQRKRDGRSGGTSRLQEEENDRALVLTPSVHVIPSLALKRSKWTRELEEDAACGLYVDDERRELEQIASSTLVRLEERLQREAADQEIGRHTATGVRLNDLLHVPHAQDTSLGICDASTPRESAPTSRRRRRQTWTPATLEVTIDRLVLDDHLSFSLADRIETQLRSLNVSYTHLLHAQPWDPLFQRIDAFVEARLLHPAKENAVDSHGWLAQTQLDAQNILQSLSTLQQLHYQLLTKWNELQDCYRQPTLPYRPTKLRVRHEQRATSLALTPLRAFLELDDSNDAINQIKQKLEERLVELEIKDKYLHTVLVLETVVADASSTSTKSGSGLSHSLASCWPCHVVGNRPPAFYVALFINDKQVGHTKASSWSLENDQHKPHVGVVLIHAKLRTQLQFFPDTVAVKIFERGLVVDTLLSTTSIPLLVPGHELVGSGSLQDPRYRVAAASLAPSVEWYQFSSVHAMARSRWHATFLNSSLFTTFQRHPHGRVRVHVAWVTPLHEVSHHSLGHDDQRDDEHNEEEDHAIQMTGVVLPPRRLPVAARDNAKLVGPRVNRRRLYHSQHDEERFGNHYQHDARHSGFSYERDFLVHVTDATRDPQLAVDRNDPQNAAVVRLQDQVRSQSNLLKERDVFRATSLMYDATLRQATASFGMGRGALTRRNFLLQLRDREHVAKHGTSVMVANATQDLVGKKWDHAAFDEPLPLSDHAIATNAKFLSLLRPEIPAFDHRQLLDDVLAVDSGARFSIERERKLQVLKLQDFVARVRASQVARVHNKALASAGKQRDRSKTLATIIQEQPMPLLPGAIDMSALSALFSRRRRLRPRVETRSAPTAMADWPRHCMLYVQIKSVTNVPVRVATGRGGGTTQQQKLRSRGKTRGAEKQGRKGLTPDDDDDDDVGDTQTTEYIAPPAMTAADSSHVFVEISFQGRRRRTTSTHVRTTGAVWMETVALPFHAPHDDWSPDSLQKSQDVVRLSLFDQLVRTSSPDGDSDDALLMLSRQASDAGGMPDGHAQQQRVQSFHQENRFLGSLEIPFTTLFHNHGTLDATLRCEMPIVNVGYVNGKHTSSDSGDDSHAVATAATGVTSVGADRDDDGVMQSSREATFLSVMMTLDPLLLMPVKLYEANPLSAGDDYVALAAYASHWTSTLKNVNAATQHRDFHVFVRSLAHGQTFLTRYLYPQTPPTLLESSVSRAKQLTAAQLVRFVHLIPFLDDWQLFDDGGELDVWTTSQELLELNAGDFEEHAVLLCNYLNWLDRGEANRRSFVVVATAVPEGKTVYVLRQDSYKIPQRSVLWNASTGVGYSVLDDRCPVLDISLVVSSENIYANLQPKKRLSEMIWDVETNAKAWKPFFNGLHKKNQFTLPPVQTPQLIYAETPRDYVQQVEGELREALKLEIRRWRSIKFTTTFNMDVSVKLRSELERLELGMLQGVPRDARGGEQKKTNGEAMPKDPIVELQKTRRVSGMPLNTTFTDINKVISMVKNTNIYWNDHAEVEFGLAVYVHAYPNCILSIWVYLVAIEPLD